VSWRGEAAASPASCAILRSFYSISLCAGSSTISRRFTLRKREIDFMAVDCGREATAVSRQFRYIYVSVAVCSARSDRRAI
jgi:hypothetical protein